LIVRFASVLFCLSLLALPAFSQYKAAEPPQAQITFYSNGNSWTTGIPGAKSGIFAGALFDGDQPLAYIRRGRFVTFRLSPGTHIFSASFHNHPAANSQLTLDLLANGSYFVRAVAESRGVVVVDSPKGLLSSVSCQTAHQEAEKTRPLESKHIPQDARAMWNAVSMIPPCDPIAP